MLKIKEIVIRHLIGFITFAMCAIIVLIGLGLAGVEIASRRKAPIK